MPTVEKVVHTDAGLAAELRISVMRLRRRLANQRDPGNDLSMNSMAVLGALHRCGDLSIGELAAHERVQPPSMTRTVKHLVAAGLVRRRSDENDGRLVVVSLGEEGRARVLADRSRRDEWLSQRLRELTREERDVLRRAAPILESLARRD